MRTADFRKMVIEAVTRASRRSARKVHLEMKHRVNSLATVVVVAPLVGIFGTVMMVNDSFGSFDGSKEDLMAMIFSNLAAALIPTALGLLVAVPTLGFYKYLGGRIEVFDLQMESAITDLVNYVSLKCSPPRA